MVEQTRKQLNELDYCTQAELEALIAEHKASNYANDCRYTLGKLQIEGTFPDKVAQNNKQGLNWIKESAKSGNASAAEYLTYYNIRFDTNPNLEKILEGLEKAAD